MKRIGAVFHVLTVAASVSLYCVWVSPRLFDYCLPLVITSSRSPHHSLMDRLLEEQEREERSKDESLRLLRASGDATDVTYYHDADVRGESESSRSTAAAAAAVDDDIELQQLSTDSNKFRSAEAEDGGNFEDEFDPILASIRKPTSRDPKRASPRRRSTSPTPTGQTTAASASALEGFESSFLSGESRDRDLDTSITDDGENAAAGADSKGVFASGLLSMFPENIRARAEGVMAQSSASISKSAGAFRSALETGGAAAAAGKGKRRESDPPPYPTDAALRAEEGRGKNGAGGGRRMLGDTDDDVPMVNVNDLLSDDEVRQENATLKLPYDCVLLTSRKYVSRWSERYPQA